MYLSFQEDHKTLANVQLHYTTDAKNIEDI